MKKHHVVGVRMPAGNTCVRRAAEQLDCDVRTVRRLIHEGKLRAERIGLRYLGEESSLAESRQNSPNARISFNLRIREGRDPMPHP